MHGGKEHWNGSKKPAIRSMKYDEFKTMIIYNAW